MEYFTLSEDLEKIESSKIKFRNRIFGGLVVVILFFLLRNSGFLQIEYNKSCLKGNHESKREIHEFYDEGTTGSINDGTKTGNINANNENFSWSFGINLKGGDFSRNDKEYLIKLIREKIYKEKILSKQFELAVFSIQKLEMSGGYWLPIIKSGESSYRISVENKVFKNTYYADFSGEIELEVYGLCTIDKLKKILQNKLRK